MCGIIGYVGKKDAAPLLVEGLLILENRGYDSAGMATLAPGEEIRTTKFASGDTGDAIARLKDHLSDHTGRTTGIAHTRWATHGGKTDANTHPHNDAQDRIALVHNGIIENHAELREELRANGIVFRSETDTEVVAQLIGQKLSEGKILLDAVKETLSRLEGTWGLVVMSKENPQELIVARNGSPILLGVGNEEMFVASEASAFSRYTKDYIALDNGELAVVTATGTTLDRSRMEAAPDEIVETSPAPYPHWTIKEIEEQPEAISRAMNNGARLANDTEVKLGGLEERKEVLRNIKHLVIAACGTSYHAGLEGAQIMRALHSFETVQVIDASECTSESLPPSGGGLLVLSQSGETKDTHRTIGLAHKAGIPCFSVVNAVGSLIARSTQCGVYLNAGREHGVASTKAFTTQTTVLVEIAIWFAQIRGNEEEKRRRLIADLRRLSSSVGMAIKWRAACKRIAETMKDAEHCFVLGKGLAEPIAREGALKIKEITYVHAEGYPGGALKHGPFALITPGMPVFLIILNDAHAGLMQTAAQEVRARGAFTIILTDHPPLAEGVADEVIIVPNNGTLTALVATIPFQLIAYELALLRGIHPDKPRNLAKAVTVD